METKTTSDGSEARHELTDNILPFWLNHRMDSEYGGVLTGLDRPGSLVESDKSMWFQGRFAWILARTWLDVEPDDAYLDAAESCVHFLDKHGFDERGRMWYRVTRDGKPLRMRRYLFTECFTAAANAAVNEATGDLKYLRRAVSLLELILHYRDTPGLLEPKVVAETRPTRGFALPMILLNVAQAVLQAAIGRRPGGSGRRSAAIGCRSGASGCRLTGQQSHRSWNTNARLDVGVGLGS